VESGDRVSRRNNVEARCRQCRLHQSLCMCALIPRVETRTRVALVIHRLEARKTTNTGRLATLCLPNSVVVERGHEHAPSTLAPDLLLGAALLFPHPDAIPLGALDPAPRTLIVPDGTWRQASKMRQRVAGLRDIPCVSLPPDVPSAYRLRSEAHPHGLATIEAIARALGVLDGLEVRRALERALQIMVERTLWARGLLQTDDVTGGIPAGVKRHDPRAGGSSRLALRS
jgi:DTW domain-containing protein YfiP